MAHDIIIILSEIEFFSGQEPDSRSFLQNLRQQVELTQAAWRASEDLGEENHEAHEWLENVQAALSSAKIALENLSANCPIEC